MQHGKRVVLVAAVADNGVIGADNAIPWHLPTDFAHFKQVTAGQVLVMGRRTHESIGRPLPGRTNIVVTRDRQWSAPGVVVAHSLADAFAAAADLPGDLVVMGGAQLYAEALPLADAQVLTEVHLAPEGDTVYPAWSREHWRETRRQRGDDGGVALDWVWWERVG